MAFEKIATKYIADKKKQVVLWDDTTGNVKIQIIDSNGKIIKENIKQVKR